jgi:aspartate/methionine/tyrosine aminotransferase
MAFDLAWGHSGAVRKAFLDTYNGVPLVLSAEDLHKFDYPEHEGDKGVVSLTHQIIRRQLGLSYKHLLIVNGATGGVTITLRAFNKMGFEKCMTRMPPIYVRYPGMIDSAGMRHVLPESTFFEDGKHVFLLDLPSNPKGFTDNPFPALRGPTILDGVYYNNVYTNGYIKPVAHDVLIGSYSKLLGLNGIRIGWIAMNDDLLYGRIKELVTSEYCGLSMTDSLTLKHIMKAFKWETFEARARENLNYNREQWSKLERYFEGSPVSDVGAFYYGKMDASCKDLMERAGVKWTSGDVLCTNNEYGRFNLGQECDVVRLAVKEVLKNDGLL